MSHLSTLRPLPQRLLERLWLILSGYVPIAIEYHMTMNALNDDCLLILLDTLTMSQLLQLRGVCRRLYHLIEGQCLRQFKTLVFTSEKPYKEKSGKDTVRMHFVSRKDPYWNISFRNMFMQETPKLSTSLLIPLRTRAWPLSLPYLLPNLLSLTLEYFLVDQVDAQTEEQLAVNRRFVPYLNSNWSKTLTTLFLSKIHVPPKPQPDNGSFAQLNQLINLKHLFIDFSRLPEPEGSSFLLPDSMPVFGQLLSFFLNNYAGSNTAILLNQLGPDLSFLSLYKVNCSEDDCIAFLRARPNYAQTITTFDVSLKNMRWKLFTVASQSLNSLVELQYSTKIAPRTELDSILTDLSLLLHLQYIRLVPLSVAQLRVLLLRQHWPGALPQLTSIRQAEIRIYNHEEENGNPFQPDELFDQLLPLVSLVFCRLEKLNIKFYQGHGRRRQGHGRRRDAGLGEQFSTKMGQLFPNVKRIKAVYFV